MFALGILIGIYSYVLFLLGMLGLFYKPVIILVTIVFLLLSIYYLKNDISHLLVFLKKRQDKLDKFSKAILLLIVIICIVDFVGAIGPETTFDALWYHLTLPKLFLSMHKISHIPGGLFYYSDMPKLGEMFYSAALSFGNEAIARLIHFSFGLLSLVALFKLARKFFDAKGALLTVLVFASNIVFMWESQISYIDLFRTFFEIMALWGFVNWYQSRDKKWLMESSVMLGLAISTKLIALGSVLIFAALFVYILKNKEIKIPPSGVYKYFLLAFFVVLPWFVSSYINTGNPVYPLFTSAYQTHFSFSLLNPINIVKNLYALFLHSSDPISPIYLIVAPLILVFYRRIDGNMRIIFLYSVFALIIWYIIPQTGGGRFILPYLPAFSILTVFLINLNKCLSKFLTAVVILIAVSSIGYRTFANLKYIPEILGFESKQQFLAKNLNFNFGDFYDTDNYFKDNLKSSDTVLLYGFHNLYYTDFPFIDSSFVTTGEKFNFIATQNTSLPSKYSFWKLIYQNPTTHVKLYSLGGTSWYY